MSSPLTAQAVASPAPTPHQSFASVSTDAAHLLDALNVPRAAAMGTSCGGPYAAATAALQPSRVSALGLLEPLAPTAGPGAVEKHPKKPHKHRGWLPEWVPQHVRVKAPPVCMHDI